MKNCLFLLCCSLLFFSPPALADMPAPKGSIAPKKKGLQAKQPPKKRAITKQKASPSQNRTQSKKSQDDLEQDRGTYRTYNRYRRGYRNDYRRGYRNDYRRGYRNDYRNRYRYRYRYRYRRYRRYRRKQKGPRWRHDRFFWSTEVGYAMYYYSRYTSGIERPFHFNGFAISGRWGYASQKIIFTGDVLYAFGSAVGLQDGGFMGHLGMTLGILPVSWMSIDFGTGLEVVTSFDSQMNSPAMLLPLEFGATFRWNFKRMMIGFRVLSSFTFGFQGMGFGLRTLLVLGSV